MPSRRLRSALVAASMTVALCVAIPSSASADTACPQPDAQLGQLSELDLNFVTICLVNEERTSRGLAPVTFNAQLFAAGSAHAADMVAKTYFSHTGQDGSDPESRALRAQYSSIDDLQGIGEVLGWGSGTLATPRQVVAAWMASTSHRETILDPVFREAAVGIAAGAPVSGGGDGSATYAGEFGRRATGTTTQTAEAAGTTSSSTSRSSSASTSGTTRVVTRKRCRTVRSARTHRKVKRCRKVRVRVSTRR